MKCLTVKSRNFRSSHKSLTSTLISTVLSATLLVACGGGGGGSAKSASTPTINEANKKQVVAAAMRSTSLSGSGNPGNDGEVGVTFEDSHGTLNTTVPLRYTRAAQPVADVCTSGRMLIDDVTGEKIYENCTLSLAGQTLRFNGSTLQEDLSGDATSNFDHRESYNNYSFEILLSETDHITSVLNGVTLDNYSETGGNAEANLRFTTSFTCRGVSGSYGGEFKLESDSQIVGAESSYEENGEITYTNYQAFDGTLTVTTMEPMRYRDNYNDNQPYDGRIQFAAADGSAVTIVFAVGGLYIDGQFYTWEQYNNLFVVDDALAPCLAP